VNTNEEGGFSLLRNIDQYLSNYMVSDPLVWQPSGSFCLPCIVHYRSARTRLSAERKPGIFLRIQGPECEAGRSPPSSTSTDKT